MCIQNLVGFCQFVLKILSENEILILIKGRNSVKIWRKMTGNNPKLDLVNVNHIQNLVRFCQSVLKILSGNKILTAIKGCNSVKILQKMTGNNPKLDLVNVNHIQNLIRFCRFVLKILSGNKILTAIKGCNSVKILQKNADVHIKFGQILSIRSQNIERKQNSYVNQWPSLHQNFAKNYGQQSQARA